MTINGGVRTCTLFFFYLRFAVHESIGPARYRVGPVWLPRPDRDRAGLRQRFSGDMSIPRARPSARQLESQKEKHSFELRVIAMTITHQRAAAVKHLGRIADGRAIPSLRLAARDGAS